MTRWLGCLWDHTPRLPLWLKRFGDKARLARFRLFNRSLFLLVNCLGSSLARQNWRNWLSWNATCAWVVGLLHGALRLFARVIDVSELDLVVELQLERLELGVVDEAGAQVRVV